MRFLKNNALTIMLFIVYIALFSGAGMYLDKQFFLEQNKLLTFVYFDYYILFNIAVLTFWAISVFLKKETLFKIANSAVFILSSLAFSVLAIMYYEASFVLDRAHWPLSNLYEVSIFFYAITITLAFIFTKMQKKLTVFLVALLFFELALIAWLESIGQNMYKELMPALKSYWLPSHVAANFIGYGAFCIAGMAGLMGIIKHYTNFKYLPSVDSVENISFKAIALGFPLFTIATILGSLWAYEAWGAYWSWDPKETWALIVWLVYGIYLHLRVSNKVSKQTLCMISFVALFVTLFCFLGVNLYLSGLHSYGQLN